MLHCTFVASFFSYIVNYGLESFMRLTHVRIPCRDITVEFDRDAAKRRFVADICLTKTTRRQSADTLVSRDDDRAATHARRMHRRGNRSPISVIN